MTEPPNSLDHGINENKAAEEGRLPADLQRESDRILLARYAPPSVVVNDQLEIVQTRGHTGPYLELPTGKISMNVLKMARPGLLYELRNAIEEARETNIDAVRHQVVVDGDGSAKTITVRVSPFKTPVQDKPNFLVVFAPDSGTEVPVSDVVPLPLSDDERTLKDRQITQLKQELAATKEYLQSIIEAMEATNEELQSANQEIQSGNEELQSTNEELQTSKEELESANEELRTVNEEMQHRNEQLDRANDDLNNLLNSVNLPMVMVGPELNIRRFTPQAGKVLGLTASDVGRPIARLRLNLVDVSDLEQLMLNVIAEVRPEHKRIKDAEGKTCGLRVMPYRASDNRIDGVVLSVLMPDGPNGYDVESGETVERQRVAKGSTSKAKKPYKKR